MASPARSASIVHRHLCPQCHEERMCNETECAPQTPGTTSLICEPCASHPKTLLDYKRELMDGRNELYAQFFASITEQESLTPDQQQTVTGYLAGAVEKRDRLADFIKGIEEEAKRLQERERQLAERRQEFEKVARMFRGSVLLQLTNWQGPDGACKMITRVDGLESSFRVRKNPKRVEIYDETALPGKYITYQPVPDKRAIADALERGEAVPGARLGDQTYCLQIR